jgi:NAD dependent epimerase/dehydratase family enzyme
LRIPGFALRAVVGEMAPVGLIKGQRIVPKRTLELGFRFSYPTIDEAMAAVARRPVAETA